MADQPIREDRMKAMVIVALTFVFVSLYIAAMFGKLGVTPDEKAIALLQPVVYVIIGYYFGRMPSEANEKRLQNEADTKGAQAVDATAKVKAARAVLTSQAAVRSGPLPSMTPLTGAAPAGPSSQPDARVEAALRILDAEVSAPQHG
jgi:hypothetical protein